MATLEIAKNVWWNTLTRDEQVQYLKDHPRSRLKVTKRKSSGKKTSKPDKKGGGKKAAAEQPKDDGKPDDTSPAGAPVSGDGGDSTPAEAPKQTTPKKLARKLHVELDLGLSKKHGYQIHKLENYRGKKEDDRGQVLDEIKAKARAEDRPIGVFPANADQAEFYKSQGFKQDPDDPEYMTWDPQEEARAKAAAEAEQQRMDNMLQKAEGDGTHELDDAQRQQAADQLVEEVAPAFEPDKVMDKLTDDHKKELDNELKDAADEKDPDERRQKFLRAATKLGIRLGMLTMAVAFAGAIGSPELIFLPSVMGSIWDQSTDWAEDGASFLENGVKSIYKRLSTSSDAKSHVNTAIQATADNG